MWFLWSTIICAMKLMASKLMTEYKECLANITVKAMLEVAEKEGEKYSVRTRS